ncbi:Hpt domain-containing protein [Endozoicomonas sp. SCSIO W0465]|uniref:hybrid sensor histidine kinase/response regulator n=1 Tax=Endozoicomonas sp. SCSIO W0465 TaxID=2918516 RepID=UPI002074DFC5|nr:Hpt domain-containing protein [Endozoicomonas sp. SCSIO W0465]USE36748.1 Hpt domain-containing protein [Endozoicomonas sp. SCSIO W0465]
MVEQREYIGLDWVIGEIESTLTEARQDLEQYADSTDKVEFLESCRAKIQQIHSTLKILKQNGARLLTREILLLIDSLKTTSVANDQEQLVVLIQAMLQLPGYLAHTSRSGKDTPGLLKNLLSEMRQLRGQQSLSDIDFFAPAIVHTITPIPEAQLNKLQASGFTVLVRKIRQKYQLCLAGVLRNSQREQQLTIIGKIFAKLQNLCWDSPISPLWDACTAFSEGLKEGSIAIDNHAITILREMDKELKCLSNEEAKRLNTPPSEEILREILYRIAKANSRNALILSLQQRYSLDQALESKPEDNNLISLDAATPVVKAIKEQLAYIKDALDLYQLNPEDNKSRLQEQLATSQQISDTLSMLGLDPLQKIMQKAHQNLQLILSGDHSPGIINDTLIHSAAQLLEVESGLNQFMGVNRSITDQHSVPAQINDIHQTVIHEARQNLEQAKSAVVDYLGSDHNQEFLAKLLSLIKSIRGGLAIIPLSRVAELISRCSGHIQHQWLDKNLKPSLDEMEALADTLSSLEYYLEQLSGGASSHGEKTLDIIQESLDKLESSVEAAIAAPQAPVVSSTPQPKAKANPFAVQLLSDQEIAALPQEAADHDVIEFHYEEPLSSATGTIASGEKEPSYGPTIEFTTDSLSPAQEITGEQSTPCSPSIGIVDMGNLIPEAVPIESLEQVSEDPILTVDFSLGEDDEDDDLHEIFVEEATDVQQQLKALIPAWLGNLNDTATTNEIRRAFHTLKGSGRMIGAEVIGELAWSVENMLSSVIEGSVPASEPMAELLNEIIAMLPELVNDFAIDSQQLTPEVLLCMEKADALGKGVNFVVDYEELAEPDPQEPAMMFGNIVEDVEDLEDVEDSAEESAKAALDSNFDELIELSQTEEISNPVTAEQTVEPDTEYDQQLLEIFDHEARSHLSVVKEFIDSGHQLGGDIQITDTVQRALHTLKGSAFMADITPLAELIAAIEKTIKEFRAHLVPADSQVISMLEQGVELIEDALQQLQAAPNALELKVDNFLNWLNALHNQLLSNSLEDEFAPERLSEKQPTGQQAALFLAGDLDLLLNASSYLEKWVHSTPHEELDRFKFELKVLAENAFAAGLSVIAELCDVLHDVCIYLEAHETGLPEPLLSPFTDGFEALVEMMNQVASQQTPEPPHAVFSALREALESLLFEQTVLSETGASAEPDETFEEHPENHDVEVFLDFEAEPETDLSITEDNPFESITRQPGSDPVASESTPFAPLIDESESDQALLKLFIEEAYELLEDSAQSLETWLSNTSDLQPVHELQRCLHTLKGGALMAELNELGELSHALEDVYESIANGSCEPERAPLALIQKTHDTIETTLKALGHEKPSPDAQRMLEELRLWKSRLNASHAPTKDPDALPDYLGHSSRSKLLTHGLDDDQWVKNPSALSVPDLPGQLTGPVPEPVSTIRVVTKPTADVEEATLQPSFSETVRIPPELLESLINLAGEISINRSRIEQQAADATRTLEEMNRTILRVREQLRRLDIETQSQIISRHQGDLGNNPDFDPLEMDQYSELSQLSHSLVESASDLMDLREALQEKNRDTDSLLQQQSRTQMELQEQLMKTRMVSFSRLVPRLRKIVRQVSDDLNKPVELLVSNAEGEMDRAMLERMLAPLGHLLRNAIGHGIEDSLEERQQSGKPEAGQIFLSIRRDGADVVVELSDDGRGIDIKAVKVKAIKQKLISPDEPITDQEAIELIMKSGFSTATHVTHLSGRGVGLDVVNNSIRQLGGSIQVKSEAGLGTQFSFRLPFTLSSNRALMVQVGSSLYALPMHAIDGISMVPASILADCYRNRTPLVYGNGTEHQLIYMGALIGSATPKISDSQCPVVMVQRGSENIAVQVDAIVGSREIITKSLGIQFSGLAGVNGATILGDGRVVVILDPAALYRKHQRFLQEAKPDAMERHDLDNSDQATRVLVVDDSVTVRKVTSRLLTRQGYEVISARDGVEAMTYLSERKPDIMLLDIEMPRMDGFEVASAVRNDPELQDLPIIMITSRTGEKHRNRAFSLGVNEYIGKPFQEGPLLAAIEKLIAVETV